MAADRVRFTAMAGEVPPGLRTAEFVLRPIAVADTALDHAAVMESREYLRPWEQTGWPADDFTLEEDRDDVVKLVQRHRDRHAFTYTVLTPDESECLGCVYLLPLDARAYDDAVVVPLGSARWSEHRAIVNFWVRTSRLPSGLDERLLASLLEWLAADWDLDPYLVVTNEQVPQQVALLEAAGLRLQFTFTKPTHAGAYRAYAPLR